MLKNSVKNKLTEKKETQEIRKVPRECPYYLEGYLVDIEDLDGNFAESTDDESLTNKAYFIIESPRTKEEIKTNKNGEEYRLVPWTKKIWVDLRVNKDLWATVCDLWHDYKDSNFQAKKLLTVEVRLSNYVGGDGNAYLSHWLTDLSY